MCDFGINCCNVLQLKQKENKYSPQKSDICVDNNTEQRGERKREMGINITKLRKNMRERERHTKCMLNFSLQKRKL